MITLITDFPGNSLDQANNLVGRTGLFHDRHSPFSAISGGNMSTDLLLNKINQAFDLFDADSDGTLTEYDHMLMGRRSAESAGYAPGSREEWQLIDAYLHIWNTMHKPHIPDDGAMISRRQFIDAVLALADDPSAVRATIGALAETFVTIADTDKDGTISLEEYFAFQRGHAPGLSRAEAKEAFDHLDSDGNGSLSTEEFVNAVIEFWSSTDPDAPGNWCMGRPPYAMSAR